MWVRKGRYTKMRTGIRTKKKSERSALPNYASFFLYPFSPFSCSATRTRAWTKLTTHDSPTGPGKRLTRIAKHSLGAPLRHLAPRPGARSDWREGNARCVQQFPHPRSHVLEFPRFNFMKSTLRDRSLLTKYASRKMINHVRGHNDKLLSNANGIL